MKRILFILFALLPLVAQAQLEPCIASGDTTNTTYTCSSKGTGSFNLQTVGAGAINLKTAGTTRIAVGAAGGVTITGDLTVSSGTLVQQEKIVVPAATGRRGATASVGYVNAADTGIVTLAQNATADTWVIPITGLNRGDTITAFSVHGQVDSAGNTATVDADLRKLTAVATGSTDASVGAITQVSKTADYLMNEEKTGLTEVVEANEVFYVLVTTTTAATTDVELLAVEVTVTRGNE